MLTMKCNNISDIYFNFKVQIDIENLLYFNPMYSTVMA